MDTWFGSLIPWQENHKIYNSFATLRSQIDIGKGLKVQGSGSSCFKTTTNPNFSLYLHNLLHVLSITKNKLSENLPVIIWVFFLTIVLLNLRQLLLFIVETNDFFLYLKLQDCSSQAMSKIPQLVTATTSSSVVNNNFIVKKLPRSSNMCMLD